MGQPASFKKITNISMACIIGVHMTVLQEIYAMMYNAMMYSIKLQLIITHPKSYLDYVLLKFDLSSCFEIVTADQSYFYFKIAE
jgi:hypothetical protein